MKSFKSNKLEAKMIPQAMPVAGGKKGNKSIENAPDSPEYLSEL